MDDALHVWASFYHLVFRDGDTRLHEGKIRWALRRVRNAFDIGFEYYRSSSTPPGYRRSDIEER